MQPNWRRGGADPNKPGDTPPSRTWVLVIIKPFPYASRHQMRWFQDDDEAVVVNAIIEWWMPAEELEETLPMEPA